MDSEARWAAHQTANSHELRDNLRGLLNLVEHDGAHVTITRYNTPAAVIVPVKWYEEMRAALAKSEEPS